MPANPCLDLLSLASPCPDCQSRTNHAKPRRAMTANPRQTEPSPVMPSPDCQPLPTRALACLPLALPANPRRSPPRPAVRANSRLPSRPCLARSRLTRTANPRPDVPHQAPPRLPTQGLTSLASTCPDCQPSPRLAQHSRTQTANPCRDAPLPAPTRLPIRDQPSASPDYASFDTVVSIARIRFANSDKTAYRFL